MTRYCLRIQCAGRMRCIVTRDILERADKALLRIDIT